MTLDLKNNSLLIFPWGKSQIPRTQFPVYLLGKLEGKELNLFCNKLIVQKRSPNYFLKKLICLNVTILPCVRFVVVNMVNLGARIVNHTDPCTPPPTYNLTPFSVRVVRVQVLSLPIAPWQSPRIHISFHNKLDWREIIKFPLHRPLHFTNEKTQDHMSFLEWEQVE